MVVPDAGGATPLDAAQAALGERRLDLEGLQRRLVEELQPLVADRPVVLLDFPDHDNCGDSAIWLGEERLLETLGARLTYRASIRTFQRRVIAAARSDTVLLLHGGGNFGDLWPTHHEFRCRLLEEFPHHRLIQLPQSVSFASTERRDRIARLIANHSDFHLFVRERQSFDVVGRYLDCPVKLVPDAAFMLGKLPRMPAQRPVVVLARTDLEATGGGLHAHAAAAGLAPEDWLTPGWEYSPMVGRLDRASRELRRFMPRSRIAAWIEADVWRRKAGIQLQRGLRILDQSTAVVTDRLHAQILCELLGIPNVAVDTGYGKIRSSHETWLAGSGTSRLVLSAAEAVAAALRAVAEAVQPGIVDARDVGHPE
jgi:exopolysaccharide biosynthesis predicted pyruvyltransferase EpsI